MAKLLLLSLVKPLFYGGLLFLAVTLLSTYANHTFLRSVNPVRGITGGVSNSSEHATTSNVPANPGSNARVPAGSLHGSPAPVVRH